MTTIAIGPWGGNGGSTWSYEAKGAISKIVISHDNCIHNISFTSEDAEGNVDKSQLFGTTKGRNTDEIKIDIAVEKLNGVSGTFDKHNTMMVVTSLSFTTSSNKSFGPYGKVTETSFSLPIKDGVIKGFHGRGGWYLDAIGVHLSL